MTQHITITEVAKAAGVSVTTVSRILNGHYEKMRPATRRRVEKTIRNLNFVPQHQPSVFGRHKVM